MQTGELTESVRNRSVFRELHLKITGDGGQRQEELSETVISLAGPLPGYADMPWRQVTAAANSLAAKGAAGVQLSLQGIIPNSMDESLLREHMKQFAEEAEENGMFFCNADIQVSDQVAVPQYFVTAIGTPMEVCARARACSKTNGKHSDSKTALQKAAAQSELSSDRNEQEPHRMPEMTGHSRPGETTLLRPGQELVAARPIALTGTAALARVYEEKLRSRFPYWLVDRAKGFDRWMSITEAARAASHFGACPMYCVAQGGIFSALWEMAEQAGVGLEVDLRTIPVRQETIEICEYLDVNPYYLYSAGTLLIGTGQAETLVHFLGETDIPAGVIGRVTDKNDRIIHNGENRRFLDRPKRDELWRLSGAQH